MLARKIVISRSNMIIQCLRKTVMGGSVFKLRRSIALVNGMVNIVCKPKLCSISSIVPEIAPDNILSDLDTIKKLWNVKPADEIICPFLFECFAKEKNGFIYALNICHVKDYNLSDDLMCAIMYALQQWTSQNDMSELLTEKVKAEAFRTALRRRNRPLVHLVCSVYKITSNSEFVKDVINSLLAEGKYIQVCIAIIVLKMQREYPLEKILLPVINMKNSLLKLYVKDYPDLQMQLACYLDKTLEMPQNSLSSRRVAPSFIKMFSHFVKDFAIPKEKCPNLCKIKSIGAMNLLIKKKYSEQSIADENWEDNIVAAVFDYPDIQKKLIYKLVAENDHVMARKMAKKFKIPPEECPSSLFGDEGCNEISCTVSEPQNIDKQKANKAVTCKPWDKDVKYLPFSLNRSSIKYITSTEEFENCLHDLTLNHRIVGIDAEWKSRGANKNRLSLLQLAVPDKVYLVDIIALEDYLEEHHWDTLVNELFGNPNILKLGCGLMCDVMVLLQGNKCSKGQKMKFTHLLDVSVFFQKLLSVCPDLVPGFEENIHDSKNSKGLSKICHILLGYPLNKTNQFSDWEVRPLTEFQIIYGALDAHCLLLIYDQFKALALAKKLNFDKLLNISISLSILVPNEYKAQKRRMKWSRQTQGFDVQPAINIGDFKVLVDISLQNLGKTLRLFGADVVFLTDTVNDNIIEAAKEEGRIILACSSFLQQLYELLDSMNLMKISAPRNLTRVLKESTDSIYFTTNYYKCFDSCIKGGMCYTVLEHLKNDESIVARIFQQYNVRIDARAIYSHAATDNS